MASICEDNDGSCSIASTGKQNSENLLVAALEQVLVDDSFKVNAPQTVQARKSAEFLLKWCRKSENGDTLKEFTSKLTVSLKKVITSCATKSWSYNYDKLWRGFFILRSGPDFISQWTNFLEPVTEQVKPVLYQHLTDLVFRKLLNDHFQVLHLQQDQQVSAELTEAENGALRYVAGYICRQLRRKLERESHEFKEEMILCLMEMIKDKDIEDHGTDEEWTKLIDRGGLWHVKETTYQFFRATEYAVREVLKKFLKPSPTSKPEMIQKITSDDDVLFYWLIVTADFEIDDQTIHETLLHKIVELFFTVRGFSLASVWLEKYKQSTKKPTQRTKSLRRDLHDGPTEI